jgi:hypothetical protein
LIYTIKCNGTTVNDDLEEGSPGLFPRYCTGIPLEKLGKTQNSTRIAVTQQILKLGMSRMLVCIVLPLYQSAS